MPAEEFVGDDQTTGKLLNSVATHSQGPSTSNTSEKCALTTDTKQTAATEADFDEERVVKRREFKRQVFDFADKRMCQYRKRWFATIDDYTQFMRKVSWKSLCWH